jgi:hypothetical protein
MGLLIGQSRQIAIQVAGPITYASPSVHVSVHRHVIRPATGPKPSVSSVRAFPIPTFTAAPDLALIHLSFAHDHESIL